jgi:hypothetical protein
MWGGTPTPYGPCSFFYDPYHHVRNCPSIRQISNNIFGHKKTSLSRPGNDNYFDSYNPTWSQQSNISWKAQDPGIHAPQFHGLQHQSYQQFYDQSAPQQQYQAEPPPPEVFEELLETIKEMTQNTQQFFEEMRALRNKQVDILKEEECQGQLVANPNEYYMEDEYIYYHEQTATTPRNEENVEENFCEPSLEDPLGEHFDQFYQQVVVENQVDERKEE